MMASLEDELKDLKEKNNELVQKVQYWKVLAGQRENEKINLMQEMNELRLQLSILRSNNSVQARNFESAMHAATKKALDQLVGASNEIAHTMNLTRAFKDELVTYTPRIGSIGTPAIEKKDKVNRVPPMILGGQPIQPVVALTMLDTSHTRSAGRSPNRNRNVTERAVPMRIMLQDFHIPLTRVDVDRYSQSLMETEDNNDADDSSVQSQRDDNEGIVIEESQGVSEDDFDSTRVLDAVEEDSEPDSDSVNSVILPRHTSTVNPVIEEPSIVLGAGGSNQAGGSRFNLEPDSTTEVERLPGTSGTRDMDIARLLISPRRVSREFSPTVRRRKRPTSPPPPATPRRADQYSPRPSPARRLSNSGRVLKVLVAKMRLEGDSAPAPSEGSPPKRAAPAALAFDAPSPNGATVPGLIVSEASQDELESVESVEAAPARRRPRAQRTNSHRSHSSDELMDVDRPSSRREHARDTEDRNINTSRRTNSRERSRERPTETDRQRTASERQRQNSTERSHRETSVERSHVCVRERSRERLTETERQRTTSERQRQNSTEHVHRETSVERSHVSVRERSRDRQTETDRHRPASERPRQNSTTSVERAHVSARERTGNEDLDARASGDAGHKESRAAGDVRSLSRGAYDSDSGSGGEREGRSRRQRQRVAYKEKPLNRKMRR